MVTPPSVIFSNRPFSKEIISSGTSNRFRITCSINIPPMNNCRRIIRCLVLVLSNLVPLRILKFGVPREQQSQGGKQPSLGFDQRKVPAKRSMKSLQHSE